MLVCSFLVLISVCALISLVWRTQNNGVLFALDTEAAYLADVLVWSILVPLAVPCYAIVGVLLAFRQETRRIGWICLIFALTTAIQDICWQYAYRTFVVAVGSLPAGQAFGLAAGLLGQVLSFFPYILILLLFPTGCFLSPRWRLIAWGAGLCTAGLALLDLFTAPRLPAGPVANPLQVKALQGVASLINVLGFWTLTLLLFAALGSIIVRWRRAPREQHRQLTWLVLMGIVVAGLWLLSVVAPPLPPYVGVFLDTLVHVGLSVGLPVALGIALLRYRLYELRI
ncbi:MAG: hypothetical protein PVSMB5_10490 [Ktedonobacteraceae bacterium]